MPSTSEAKSSLFVQVSLHISLAAVEVLTEISSHQNHRPCITTSWMKPINAASSLCRCSTTSSSPNLAEKTIFPRRSSSVSTPLRRLHYKTIAAFVKEYPKSGLMFCLGEALKGETSDPDRQLNWMTRHHPGIHEGMAQAGLKQDDLHVCNSMPPRPRRTSRPRQANGFYPKPTPESNTTANPSPPGRTCGQWMEEHQAMTKASAIHSINVHILANLELHSATKRPSASLSFAQGPPMTATTPGASTPIPLKHWNQPDAPENRHAPATN